MADKKTYTGLSKNYATVPAFSITTIDYLDTKPNYFRVQNRGTTELYCSTNNMPTTKHYDFAVPGKKMKMFAEPYNRTRLYIFNPSGTDVEVAALSFQAEFDPLTLALSEIEVEVPSNFETSTAITSFNASLPTGNNKIGKVEVTNGPSAENIIAIQEASDEIAARMNQLLASAPVSGRFNLANIMVALELFALANTFHKNVKVHEGKNQTNPYFIISSNVEKYIAVHMLTNDGEGDLTLTIRSHISPGGDTTAQNLTLKAGESISDLKFQGQELTVKGTNFSFRALVSVTDVNTGGGV